MKIDRERTAVLFGEITYESTDGTLEKISELEKKEPGKEIVLLLNSSGGLNSAGFMFIDLVRTMSINLTIIGMGMVGSVAVPIFSIGKKRIATGHTMFFFHKVGRTVDGDARLSNREMDTPVESDEITATWYSNIIEKQTGGAFKAEEVTRLMKAEHYLLPEKMRERGLVHEII